MLKFLMILLSIASNSMLPAESVYCYICSEANPSCSNPPNIENLRWNIEPCKGECVVFTNPYTGALTRSCSTSHGIMEPQGQVTKTISGVQYSFCNTHGCNIGEPGKLITTTTTTTTLSIEKCPGIVCKHGSNLDLITCSCQCTYGSTGRLCETLLCEIPDAPLCTSVSCDDDPIIKYFCMQKCNTCGLLTTTPKATTTTEVKCPGIVCQHEGYLQISTCACQCLPSTTGQYCETILCDNPDHIICPELYCHEDPAVKYFCPQKCKLCPSVSTTTKLTSLITEHCAGVVCQSASSLDFLSCACNCLPGTSGRFCEIIDCYYPDPPACTSLNCNDDEFIKYLCIQKCNTCGSKPATTPTTTTTLSTSKVICPGVACQSASELDINSCSCICVPGTTGRFCEIIDCNYPDNPFCSFLSCNDDPNIMYYCIQKCNACAQTKTTQPSITTTKTCPEIVCQSGSFINQETCNCQCLPGTTGKYCEKVYCDEPDHPVCESLNCNDDPSVQFMCIQKCKPACIPRK